MFNFDNPQCFSHKRCKHILNSFREQNALRVVYASFIFHVTPSYYIYSFVNLDSLNPFRTAIQYIRRVQKFTSWNNFSSMSTVNQLCNFRPSSFASITYTDTERSSRWLSWSSLETLKTSFNVPSVDNGSHSDDLSVSVYVWLENCPSPRGNFRCYGTVLQLIPCTLVRIKLNIGK